MNASNALSVVQRLEQDGFQSGVETNFENLADEINEGFEQFRHKIKPQSSSKISSDQMEFLQIYANREFFGGRLPLVLATLDHSGRSCSSYYKPEGGTSKDGEFSGVIGIAGSFIVTASFREVFGAFIRAFCQHVIFTFADKEKKPTSGYFGVSWSVLMRQCGLMPSSTGMEGGNKTGNKMLHYVISGGAFDLACQELEKREFAITWGLATKELHAQRIKDVTGKDILKKKPADKKKGKVKFTCPACEEKRQAKEKERPAWAAPTRKIDCGDCHTPMVVSE